ncbi:uncharacterized protein IL334_004941 [Kwoniella shivajii]|uniref:WHIM1 domain-containing protein n=1 Tax=Kwoniella shivajii TaxID=564305 RepID=A0ABZ1D2Z0_9TREE|nr:hypothetical protein IL334_004941 [Kwoniella shivajii]
MPSSNSKVKLKVGSSSSTQPSTGIERERSGSTPSVEETKSSISPIYISLPLDKESKRKIDSKSRHDEDVKKHHVVEAQVSNLDEDWQVAYTWSFIIKFNLRSKISRLECLEDFERCLVEPMANRPDDILESILICFLGNLKPGSRNITPENIQSQLSNYINDQLSSTSEWTVWDRGWPINEEDRGSCCTYDRYRSELGRLRYYGEPSSARAENNPIKRMEEKGSGIFELDWRERVTLLRQLVDWQLTHSESIRNIIHREFPAKAMDSKAKRPPPAEITEKDSIVVKELGLNRDRARVWAFDDSWRLYKSGNPYKRPCQLISITTNRDSYDQLITELETFSQLRSEGNPDEIPSTAKSGKLSNELKKLVQARKNEASLAERLKERIEAVEKEEGRVQRSRRKIAQVVEMQQRAELRSTRTRRQGRKVDYVYDDNSEFDSDSGPTRRKRPSPEFDGLDSKGKPIIPGERRSARTSGRQSTFVFEPVSEILPVSEQISKPVSEPDVSVEMSRNSSSTSSTGGNPEDGEMSEEGRRKKRERMKGYAWVEEYIPFERLSDKDKEEFLRTRKEANELNLGTGTANEDWKGIAMANGTGIDIQNRNGHDSVETLENPISVETKSEEPMDIDKSGIGEEGESAF